MHSDRPHRGGKNKDRIKAGVLSSGQANCLNASPKPVLISSIGAHNKAPVSALGGEFNPSPQHIG